jgi:alkaline phosphatase
MDRHLRPGVAALSSQPAGPPGRPASPDGGILPRRRFLQVGAAGAAAAFLAGDVPRAVAASPSTPRRVAQARNVILCIADGVSSPHYGLARAFKGAPLTFEAWACGQLSTASADAFITDSAAAGSALATGHRTGNGRVSVDDGGRPRRTILEAARDGGRATGLVVTGGLTTATAAVFAAHHPDRGASLPLARQLVQAGLTVMFSGGQELLAEPLEAGGSTTMGGFLRDRGYALPTTAAELAATAPGPVFGQFAEGSFHPVIDRAAMAPTQPMLPALARHALRTLALEPEGFFLMVEGTQTDWAGHQNDPAMLVHEMLEFDGAVAEVQAFAAGRDDTLVIVLSDHGTGGLAMGNARSQAAAGTGLPHDSLVAPLRDVHTSTVAMWETHGIAESPDVATIRRVVEEHLRVSLSVAQAEEILVASRNPHRDNDCDGIGRVFCRDFTYLDWTTHEHTADDVPLFAWGPGAPSGTLHLADVGRAMADAMGLLMD